ncbi:hypothetical protein GXM21_04745 [Megamonas funiformis]|uniref:Uncharacterized protein n=1 Tax=Megamonas funiformis YIT 11815 TaxID=742816 RepID=A0ABP2NL07_9FIRM|nr:hypothetical protein [Megamonas funiformis]EHR37670.1 hypothetical protein HMPREF9454_00974 [Megamonas funiformis YIT 11815]QIB59721.1 hypothetical protein GXM21_04745 [Megamonas funiformis]
MTEVIFVSTKRNSSIGYLQQGTSVPYEKPYFNALVEKVLGKKSSEYISHEIESYSNKKRFVIVLRDEQLKTFLKAKALIATCKDKRIKDENISDLIMSGVLG